jgi:hypothetical protein
MEAVPIIQLPIRHPERFKPTEVTHLQRVNALASSGLKKDAAPAGAGCFIEIMVII